MTRYDRRRPITLTDLRHALEAHVQALAACGITYDGRIGLDEGSKMYGRAFRLYLTDKLDRCQERRYRMTETGEMVRWPHDLPGEYEIAYDWDHADCDRCQGTKLERCSGHYPPPIGDDYLGMTKAEAYETLTARTRTIYDTAERMTTT